MAIYVTSKAYIKINTTINNSVNRQQWCLVTFCMCLNSLVARFLANLYTKQTVRVKWNDYISNEFSVSNGVKQGGVLSPILFSVYIDELLKRLKESEYGCYIGNTYFGALSYADDVTLLCPTKSGINRMLKIIDNFSKEFDINFNHT